MQFELLQLCESQREDKGNHSEQTPEDTLRCIKALENADLSMWVS